MTLEAVTQCLIDQRDLLLDHGVSALTVRDDVPVLIEAITPLAAAEPADPEY